MNTLSSGRLCGLLLAAVALPALLAGCSSGSPSPTHSRTAGAVAPPPRGADLDYQLGGAYRPPERARVVSRDRTARPAAGRYNICYVNAFQSQPGRAVDRWRRDHPELLLRDGGDLVVDEDWDEPLLDVSTAAKRRALAAVVGRWIDGCAEAGFDAVEPDNLDSYQRSHGRLDAGDAAAFARLLVDRAHRRGLAVAQKNTADLLPGDGRPRIGFDFAVTEECARYRECADFARAYGGRVLDVEYRERDFTAACRTRPHGVSVTLRDRDLHPAGESGHVDRHC